MSLGSHFHTEGTRHGYTELKIGDEVIGNVTYEEHMPPGKEPEYMTINLDPRFKNAGWKVSSVEWTEGRVHVRLVRVVQ